MVDYQGNSKKEKEANHPKKKALEKVIEGEATVKPPTLGVRIKNIFFGGDINTAGSYVLSEVLLPAFRNLLVETVSKGADRLIYGESTLRRRPTNYSSRVQYNNPIYRDRSPQGRTYLPDQRPIDRWAQGRKNPEQIVVNSKEDADKVIEQLIEVVDMYDVVSVADLYELLGLASTPIDNKWGWTHLSTIDVRQIRDGWQITFPPLEEIA